MVPNNTNKNNSIILELFASVFTVSSNFPDNPRTWFYFINNVDTCIVNNMTKTKVYDRPTVGRSSAEWRPISCGFLPTVFFYQMPSTDRLEIVDLLTPDRATFGRYRDVNLFKKPAECRPIIGRLSPNALPTTKLLKIGELLNEALNLGASTTKSSADQIL